MPSNQSLHNPFSILDRYVIAEMLGPFLLGVVIFTFLAMTIGVFFELARLVTDGRISLLAALQIGSLQVPTYLVLALPMSMLLTTLLTYSNLSRNSEIIALRACGINAYRLAIPALLVSLLVGGLTLLMNEALVPPSVYAATITQRVARGESVVKFQERNIFYREFAGNYLERIFFAKAFDGERMQDISLLNFNQGKLREIIVAKTAVWNQPVQNWNFVQGTRYSLSPEEFYQSVQTFDRQTVVLARTPLELATEVRTVEQMNMATASQFLKLVEKTGDERRIRRLELQIQQKASLPSVCIAFALVGTSLGLRPRRRMGGGQGFGLSVLIILGYYVFSSVANSLAEGAVLSPLIAAWLPKLVCLSAGIYLLVRSNR